jgi:uncharacterized protein YjdB
MKKKSTIFNVLRSTAGFKKLFLSAVFAIAFVAGMSAQTIKVINAAGGVGVDYTTLAAALTDISAVATPTAFELQIASDLVETVASTVSGTYVTSVKIYPTGAARTITAPGLSLISINIPNVTIDGSLDGTGAGPASLFLTTNPTAVMANGQGFITVASKGVVVKYCNISNFASGIALNAGAGLTADHNSFYNNLNALKNGNAQQSCINMGGTTALGDTLIITNNYFGGSAPLATGSWVRDSVTDDNVRGFYATYSRATAFGGRIQGNVVKNVVSQTQKGAGGKGLFGFFFREANSVPFRIEYNTISDLTYENDAANTAGKERYIAGIRLNGSTTSLYTVLGNQIYNLDNRSVATDSKTAGISWGDIGYHGSTPAFLYTIKNNIIHDLKSTNVNNGGANGKVPTASATTTGILGVSVPGAGTIEGNTIYNISNYNTGAYASPVAGIQVKVSVDATLALNNIRNNKIYGISTTSTQPSATTPYIIGLAITSGNANCYNNVVSVGDGAPAGAVVGILKYTDAATSNSTFYNNSVYVGGAANAATERNSFAFLRLGANAPTTADVVKNNVFYNARTGALNHYAIGLLTGFATSITTDNNELYSATTANLGSVTVTEDNTVVPTPLDFATWKTSVSGDAASKNVALTFSNTADASLFAASSSLKGTGVAVAAITTDIEGTTRPATPSIGAYEQVATTSITVAGAGNATTITTAAGTLQMSVSAAPARAATDVTWSVTNGTGQATISASGLLTASINGTVTVRATAKDGPAVYGELVITISGQPIAVTGITVTGAGNATTITTLAGTLQMAAAIAPANATNQNVTWSVVNGTGSATISATGLLTAALNGTVTVKATAQDGSAVYGEKIITISGQPVAVSGIVVTGAGNATTITTFGGTLQMNANVSPSDAVNKNVTWSVTNGTGQASISASGLLTAVKNGTVTVKATAQDGSAVFGELVVTISGQTVSVTGITVTGAANATTITTNAGELQMAAAIAPANATNQNVAWSVTNGTGEASISASGLLTAVKNGTVTVKATAQDGSAVFGELEVTISGQTVSVTGITVTGAANATTITTNAGELQMAAAIAPANATNQNVTWSVTNGTGEASISASGLLTAVKNGTVTVKATAQDGSNVFGELGVTISGQIVLVTGITVTGAGDATTITAVGGTLQMSAAITPAEATNQDVVWSVSNDAGEATIDTTGLLTAVKNGLVTVRATAADGSNVYGELAVTVSGQPTAVISLADQKWVVYPNPVENLITIDNASGIKSYSIVSLSGTVVLSGVNSDSKLQINVSSIASGAYILKIQSVNGNSETTFVKK